MVFLKINFLLYKSFIFYIIINILFEVCVFGWYGDDCKYVCFKNCFDKVCDVKDGRCNNCLVGWMGSYCDLCK